MGQMWLDGCVCLNFVFLLFEKYVTIFMLISDVF